MGTVAPNSNDLSSTDKENGVVQYPEELDAGALFVLKSRGSWLHCGYHLTTSIVGPVIFSFPFALALLGWVPGVLITALQGLVTFYSYNLLSVVLDHHAQLGKRQRRFRDMARDILGPRWGKYFVGPLQFAICYGAVIGCILLGGQSLKFIYLLYNQSGKMQLYQFILIFGAVPLFLAQIPSFHSLRHINLASLLLCLAYSACVTAGSIHIGNSRNAPKKDYSIQGSEENRILGAINGISIIATTYGCGIIPEIQIYLQPTNELFEKWFANPKMDQFSARNVMPRLVFRSLSVVIAATLAAMIPFFGDIMALFGAFGVIPLDFILPMVFYNLTFKPSKRGLVFWGNTLIAVASSALVAIGAVASVRQIVLDAKTYSLFANM
ncbi:GABA transporter 1-like isoform X2 [Herrania umbratica]|uniref:GABA transporter 1-like isoform X2 n=1 Tax=Herrania umbratica TaxID=108875 RepID=A0A6J1B8W9_9ROSI|nr:GABA transporter 1-like isoform X2 [Herrania umbratica]